MDSLARAKSSCTGSAGSPATRRSEFPLGDPLEGRPWHPWANLRQRAHSVSRWLRAFAAVLDDFAGAGMDEFLGARRRMALSRVTARNARKREAARKGAGEH